VNKAIYICTCVYSGAARSSASESPASPRSRCSIRRWIYDPVQRM